MHRRRVADRTYNTAVMRSCDFSCDFHSVSRRPDETIPRYISHRKFRTGRRIPHKKKTNIIDLERDWGKSIKAEMARRRLQTLKKKKKTNSGQRCIETKFRINVAVAMKYSVQNQKKKKRTIKFPNNGKSTLKSDDATPVRPNVK